MKTPKPFEQCSSSMLVVHEQPSNLAMQSSLADYGLCPNGLTIDLMQEHKEFYENRDPLDRLGVAAKVSGELAKDVKAFVKNVQLASKK